MLISLTEEVTVHVTNLHDMQLLSCLWWFDGELNTHRKHYSWLGRPVCVCTSDRNNQWQVENITKSTYKIKTPKRVELLEKKHGIMSKDTDSQFIAAGVCEHSP